VENAFLQVLFSGGPVMIALAIVSLLLYKTIIGLLVFVRNARFEEFTEARLVPLRSSLAPDDPTGERVLLERRIEIHDEFLARFRRLVRSRLRYSHALLVAAPLLGLLGTVMGMLDTFRGLSLQVGHETSRAVAEGISRALITTETGLMIAIPALFLVHWIKREFQRRELRLLEARMQLLLRLEN
jgi:biopolymer transport protein ExbB